MFFQMGFYFKQPPDNDDDSELMFNMVQMIMGVLDADDDLTVAAETFDWGDINNKLTSTQLDQIKQHLRDSLDAES